jgi:hypothetical protein
MSKKAFTSKILLTGKTGTKWKFLAKGNKVKSFTIVSDQDHKKV